MKTYENRPFPAIPYPPPSGRIQGIPPVAHAATGDEHHVALAAAVGGSDGLAVRPARLHSALAAVAGVVVASATAIAMLRLTNPTF